MTSQSLRKLQEAALKMMLLMKSLVVDYRNNTVLFPVELSLTFKVTNTQQDIAINITPKGNTCRTSQHRGRRHPQLTANITSCFNLHGINPTDI